MAGTPRPTGVAVLAILAALGGILGIIVAVVLGIMSTQIAEFIESWIAEYGDIVTPIMIPDIGGFIEAVVLAIAAVAAIVGVLALIDAYGLWIGAGWAWWLTVILSIIGIIGGIISLPAGVISIIIDGLIIYYFTRPHVKEFFGMAAPSPPPPPP